MDQAIIEKIKKLLALATSSNEHEARLAAEKANELLIRHNLKMQDLGADNEYAKAAVLVAGRFKPHTSWIVSILLQHFFVKVVRSRSPFRGSIILYLVGEKTNLQIASYIYTFLDRSFPELWRQWRKAQGRRAGRRPNYYRGVHDGLNYQLRERREAIEQETGLVVAHDHNLNAAVKKLIGETKESRKEKRRHRPSRAHDAGWVDGDSLKIRQGIVGRKDGEVRQIEGKP